MTATVYGIPRRNANIPTITGRNLAHKPRTSGQRALVAADLVSGKVRFEAPTVKQAAHLLHVSVPYVQRALRLNGDQARRADIEIDGKPLNAVLPAGNGLVSAWIKASANERAGLARIVGPDELWDDAINPTLD